MKDGTTEPLSAEASAVLSRLPDLSFMHSKVLMFPVSDCANWVDVHCQVWGFQARCSAPSTKFSLVTVFKTETAVYRPNRHQPKPRSVQLK